AGTSPEAIDETQPVADITGEQQATIPGLNPETRWYFRLIFADGTRLTTAERILPLKKVANCRDIGGYRTTDGRRTRWGRIYRSGSVAHPAESDVEYLGRLGLQLVCDLRSAEEVETAADVLPEQPTLAYRHLPITAEGTSQRRQSALLFDPIRLVRMFEDTYLHTFIDDHARTFGDALRLLADETTLPALFHCTAGKDRTGLTAALLLLTLGVPEETVIADYSQSNRYYEAVHAYAAKMLRPMAFLGVKADHMQPLLTADPALLRTALAYIRDHYGSIESYLLNAAGLDADTLARLRVNLLE
ncbi:MAG: tyrosine-protein phosphatase, partial [Anaerolineae bacterium]|nr:tyrosine-protein phosphatase [Anaerolineae bacterium]